MPAFSAYFITAPRCFNVASNACRHLISLNRRPGAGTVRGTRVCSAQPIHFSLRFLPPTCNNHGPSELPAVTLVLLLQMFDDAIFQFLLVLEFLSDFVVPEGGTYVLDDLSEAGHKRLCVRHRTRMRAD